MPPTISFDTIVDELRERSVTAAEAFEASLLALLTQWSERAAHDLLGEFSVQTPLGGTERTGLTLLLDFFLYVSDLTGSSEAVRLMKHEEDADPILFLSDEDLETLASTLARFCDDLGVLPKDAMHHRLFALCNKLGLSAGVRAEAHAFSEGWLPFDSTIN